MEFLEMRRSYRNYIYNGVKLAYIPDLGWDASIKLIIAELN